MTKTYLHAGVAHTDTSTEYMAALGMDEQTQAAVLAQLEFEESMSAAAAKEARDAAVAKIKVTVNGKTFDGDETSQSRLARAIAAAETQGIDLQPWKLADNAWAEVTTAELRQALAMAFQAQSELWAYMTSTEVTVYEEGDELPTFDTWEPGVSV